MNITIETAAKQLLERDNIAILAHHKPDGDTLGSCFGLLYALESLGKTARVECADGFPERFRIIYGDYAPKEFQAGFVVACDVASVQLLAELGARYPHVDLCIDHHKTNTHYADAVLVDPAAAATTEIIFQIVQEMGISISKPIANALYTGLTTDTGCFRFASVTARSHRIAAELIGCGAEHHAINKQMFDNKSRGRIEVEKLMMESLEFCHGGKCVIMALPADIYQQFGVTEDDLDGISAFPRRIQGVLCGITIREKEDGSHRVSMRCEPPLDAAAICARFGGGGHSGAAGCTITGTVDELRDRLQAAVGEALESDGA